MRRLPVHRPPLGLCDASIVRVLRAACLLGFLALTAAAPASAQTAVTADAVVWFTPGAPADSAARVVARVDDPSANPPAVLQTLTT